MQFFGKHEIAKLVFGAVEDGYCVDLPIHEFCTFAALKVNKLETIIKERISEYILKNEVRFAATHKKLCLPIIVRIYKKMCAGIKFSGIKVEDNIICDGHHRYIASILAEYKIEIIQGSKTSATIPVDWKSVTFEDEDWDTATKINMLNEQDAEYNDIALERIIEMLK